MQKDITVKKNLPLAFMNNLSTNSYNLIFNTYHKTANFISAGINNNYASVQNNCENYKNQKHKDHHKIQIMIFLPFFTIVVIFKT